MNIIAKQDPTGQWYALDEDNYEPGETMGFGPDHDAAINDWFETRYDSKSEKELLEEIKWLHEHRLLDKGYSHRPRIDGYITRLNHMLPQSRGGFLY